MKRLPNKKMILIHLESNAIRCAPNPLEVQHGDQVRFHCEEKDYEIFFNMDKSPFTKDKFGEKATQSTAPAVVTTDPGPHPNPSATFHYSVNLLVHGKVTHSVDPVIIVNPYPFTPKTRPRSKKRRG
jgi:hypothetical protein